MTGRPAIGGEFALESAVPTHRRPSLADRLDATGDAALYLSGRVAIRAWLRRRAQAGADTLLLPAYICESVVQAAVGDPDTEWTVRFLPVDECLEPVPEQLLDTARRLAGRGCLLAVPLFGFPYSGPLRRALSEAAAAGVAVGWDLTHALFSAWTDRLTGDRVASLRKWCGLPDGGVWLRQGDDAGRAVAGVGLKAEEPAAARFVAERSLGMAAKREWLGGAPGGEEPFLAALQRAERTLEGVVGLPGMTPDACGLMNAVSEPALVERRRANANVLLDALRGRGPVRLLHETLPDDVCPFGVPVLLDDRDAIRRALAAQRAFCPVHWPLPAAVSAQEHPEAHRLAGRMLTLPCDQRLDAEDMARLADLLCAATGG